MNSLISQESRHCNTRKWKRHRKYWQINKCIFFSCWISGNPRGLFLVLRLQNGLNSDILCVGNRTGLACTLGVLCIVLISLKIGNPAHPCKKHFMDVLTDIFFSCWIMLFITVLQILFKWASHNSFSRICLFPEYLGFFPICVFCYLWQNILLMLGDLMHKFSPFQSLYSIFIFARILPIKNAHKMCINQHYK